MNKLLEILSRKITFNAKLQLVLYAITSDKMYKKYSASYIVSQAREVIQRYITMKTITKRKNYNIY